MTKAPLPHSLPAEGNLASTGHQGLDQLMDQLRLGDNVVWHVDQLDDYREFISLWLDKAVSEMRKIVYVRFSRQNPVVLDSIKGVERVELDPESGFDAFSREVNLLVEKTGEGAYYIFDCLSDLVGPWTTEELVGNFFQTACPYLYEMKTIAYFAMIRGTHSNQLLARVYNTTQVLIELFRARGDRYIKLAKVWDRYSMEMFFPHRIAGKALEPVFENLLRAGSLTDDPATPVGSPWESVQQRLGAQTGEQESTTAELRALKAEFSRMLLGQHPVFVKLADRFLGLEALMSIRKRLIGSGRIGGKAVGMLLAREILKDPGEGMADPGVLDDHDSYFLASDVFYTFLVQNNLFRLRIDLTRNENQNAETFAEIEEQFLSGKFPINIAENLAEMLEHFGNAPIIVRSSSLLEDSFGGAFAGKYRSEFCPNQGTPEARLEQLCRAIKLVYASSLSPDALSYRRRRNLEGNEELMAVLIQKVSGLRYRQFFFPTLAGVSFSQNLYAWNNRIDPTKGIIRLVFGMGTRAVDRVGGDYPRMISVSHPLLRPEVGVETAKYSQHDIDVINLETNKFETLPIWDVLQDADYPNLHLMVSSYQDDHIEDPFTRFLDADNHYVFTFNNLLRQTPFVRVMGEALDKLEKAYGQPVDIEFTAHIAGPGKIRLNLLQCRPLWTRDTSISVSIPENIPDEDIIFRAEKVITGGLVETVDFIIYIDPESYDAIEYPPDRKTLGRVVGRLNSLSVMHKHNFILVGPGRWGSSNVDLGVNVSYADIDHTNVLVELASGDFDHAPEVSYGTHFFQDLIEEEIIYLPVLAHRRNAAFNWKFFKEAPNSLTKFLPDFESMAHCIKVIDLREHTSRVRLVADSQRQRAVCYRCAR